jgi:hypothetical protein
MGVFLRWGVFGILGVAALIYAYNANKQLAERHDSREAVDSEQSGDEAGEEFVEDSTGADGAGEAASADELPGDDTTAGEAHGGEVAADAGEMRLPPTEMPAACAEEQHVAERALKTRRDGGTLEELLRIEVIAMQSDARRRERLSAVATRWFEREGRDPDAETLRGEVLRDCGSAGS